MQPLQVHPNSPGWRGHGGSQQHLSVLVEMEGP